MWRFLLATTRAFFLATARFYSWRMASGSPAYLTGITWMRSLNIDIRVIHVISTTIKATCKNPAINTSGIVRGVIYP
jgi:hypothetical protein